jgi:GxxExxY protein
MQHELNELSYKVIGCAYKVHTALGPGLLESTYQTCLEFELLNEGLKVEREKALPVVYKGVKLEAGYRIDLLVDSKLIIEIKSVDAIIPIHEAQVMTYLKLSGKKLALLLNFNVIDMKKGINRVILKEYINELS